MITYRCPKCRQDFPGRDTRCPSCGAQYQSVQVEGTRVVDFLGVCLPGECHCPQHTGDSPCRIDLSALRPPEPAPKKHHHKAKVLRPFLHWRDKVVLDVGCREAPIGHLLAGDNDLIGADICPLTMLHSRPNALGKSYAQLLVADGLDLPLADAQVDLVIATDILEHQLEPERLLAEFRRVLKPGGSLVLTVPNLTSYNNRLSMLVGCGAGIELHQLLKGGSLRNPVTGPRFPDQRKHLRWFTVASLSAFVRANGFVVRRRLGYDPVLSRLGGADVLLRGLCQVAGVWAVRGQIPR